MKETTPGAVKAHSLILEGRSRCVVTGVEEVDLFNEQMIIANTSDGALTLAGQNLHVESLDLQEGRLIVTGRVEAAEYEDRALKPKGVMARLFR